jgi:site-specific recombinase XerD
LGDVTKHKLLKHRILIGLLYGCGLRCMEARSVRLNLDFDRKQLKVVQGKGKKDRYVPLSEHLIRGLKKYIEAEKPQDYLFNGQPCLLEQVVILTIAIHNAACNGRLSKWQKQQE